MTEIEEAVGPLASALGDIIIAACAGDTREKTLIDKAELAALRKTIRDQEDIIRNLKLSRDTAVRQRDQISSQNHVNAAEHAALQQQVEQLQREKRNLQHRVSIAEHDAASAKGMAANPDPRYNKLFKDYTACKNQRDSHVQTIAELKAKIAELEKAAEPGKEFVATLSINGVEYTREDVLKIRNESNARIARIHELEKKLKDTAATHVSYRGMSYDAADIASLLNTIEQLSRNLDNLRQAKPTMLIKGKYMTIQQMEDVIDRKDKLIAELDRREALMKRTASTLRGTTASVKRERERRRALIEERDALRAENAKLKSALDAGQIAHGNLIQSSVSHIEVGPQVVHLRILQPEGTTIEVEGVTIEAVLLPRMAGDLVAKTSEIEGLKKIVAEKSNIINGRDALVECKNHELENLRQRNANQAQTITVQDQALRERGAMISQLESSLAEANQKLNTQGIELRLTKGHLNDLRHRSKLEPSYNVTMQSGQTYVTSDVGMIPVTTEGVQMLADAYHKLRCKLDALTGYLTDWAKS